VESRPDPVQSRLSRAYRDMAPIRDGFAPHRGHPVLLVDEAGMVDSATPARLIDHVQAADAKLALVGDPAQLGEIEAGSGMRENCICTSLQSHLHRFDSR
jgi:ATP-dependent exoDNAse (exonuclease V) alpha subunit